MLTAPHFRHTKFQPFQQLKTFVLNRPSQQVRRELALGERFSGFSRLCRSIGPPQKPQESCHSEGGSGGRREGFTLKLAEERGPDSNLRWAEAGGSPVPSGAGGTVTSAPPAQRRASIGPCSRRHELRRFSEGDLVPDRNDAVELPTPLLVLLAAPAAPAPPRVSGSPPAK
jgi:hypothetical protein